jgi:hypothetical protein
VAISRLSSALQPLRKSSTADMADSLLGRMHPSSRTPRDTRDIIVAANRIRKRLTAE